MLSAPLFKSSMKIVKFYLLFFTLFSIFSCAKKMEKTVENDPVLEYVNPFIGTGGHGHTYPGC